VGVANKGWWVRFRLARLRFLEAPVNRHHDASKDIQQWKQIPIVLSQEIPAELATPILRHVLGSFMDPSVYGVNVMSNFMVENVPGHYIYSGTAVPISTMHPAFEQCCPHTARPSRAKTSARGSRIPKRRPTAPCDFDSTLFVYVCPGSAQPD